MKKKIYILEKFDFSKQQVKRLNSLGNVTFYDKASSEEIDKIVVDADVIMLDWIDPTNIITRMKSGSFVCLPFTGYGWISTLREAMNNGVTLSNTPNYSTNAVAEHHLALMLAVAKHVPLFFDGLKKKKVPTIKNVELTNKTVGIIGMGNIGRRLAELLAPFNVTILNYSRTKKDLPNVRNVSLDTFLKQSDFVCVTCALNDATRNMLDKKKLSLMKESAILTATTSGIINLKDLEEVLNEGKLFGVGLEEFMDMKDVPMTLIKHPKVVSTYHRAYDTIEAEHNRLNMAIDNIEGYIKGNPINPIK